MSISDWPAEEYAIGSFMQATVSDRYLDMLPIYPADAVLDIGCGDGSYSHKIMQHFPVASYTGIDASSNMIALAKKTIGTNPKVTLQNLDVNTMKFSKEFDCIVSFWCLQWTQNIKKSLENIYVALNNHGRFFAIFPTGDDPYILMYKKVRDSHQFPSLKNFIPPVDVDYRKFSGLREELYFLPFINPQLERAQQNVTLPSLDIYRKFVNGIAFYQGQVPDDEVREINEAMVQAFQTFCDKNYNGELRFEFSIYVLKARK